MSNLRFAKLTLLCNGLVPLALLAYDAWQHRLGANPINFAIRTTGFLTLIALLTTLAITPAARLFKQPDLTRFRRLLGLYAFAYGGLHFTLFFLLDREANISSTLGEISMRVYLMFGTTALILMIPLAVTSTDAMVKRLGYKRWKALHRLTYVIGIAAVVHYYLLVKSDVRIPLFYAAGLTLLLGYRLAPSFSKRTAKSPSLDRKSTKTWTGRLRISKIQRETHAVKTFRLVPTNGGELPFQFLPGQFLTLSLTIDGKQVKRCYTIASSSNQREFCELTIKREPNGLVSRHMHDAIRSGDELRVTAPGGRFTFTGESERAIVMLAGGVGITPLMTKIRYLTECDWPGDIHLLFSNRHEPDIIFAQELADLAQRNPRLHVTHFLTGAEMGVWEGEHGRLTSKSLERLVPSFRDLPMHVCGPDEFNREIKRFLVEADVPAERIRLESFGVKPTNVIESSSETTSKLEVCSEDQADLDEPFEIHFTNSDLTTTVEGRATVLEAAEKVGVEIAFDCRAGICGTCKVKLLSGRVCMTNQEALDESDRRKGLILACQAHCLSPITIEA